MADPQQSQQDPTASAGDSLAAQAGAALAAEAAAEEAMSAYLEEARREAIAQGLAITAAALAALWLAQLTASFNRAVRRALLSPAVAARLVAQLATEAVADAVFGAVRAITTAGQRNGWGDARTKHELSLALSIDGPSRIELVQPDAIEIRQDGSVGVDVSAGLGTEHDEQQLKRSGLSWRGRIQRAVRSRTTEVIGWSVQQTLAARGFSRKKWVTRHDARVRHTHGMADGQIVDLDQPFIVGASLMMYPGDALGGLDETINCRCRMIGVR